MEKGMLNLREQKANQVHGKSESEDDQYKENLLG